MANKNYKICSVKLDLEKDKDLIDFLEDHPTSYIFRQALRYYIKHEARAIQLDDIIPLTPVDPKPIEVKPQIKRKTLSDFAGDDFEANIENID